MEHHVIDRRQFLQVTLKTSLAPLFPGRLVECHDAGRRGSCAAWSGCWGRPCPPRRGLRGSGRPPGPSPAPGAAPSAVRPEVAPSATRSGGATSGRYRDIRPSRKLGARHPRWAVAGILPLFRARPQLRWLLRCGVDDGRRVIGLLFGQEWRLPAEHLGRNSTEPPIARGATCHLQARRAFAFPFPVALPYCTPTEQTQQGQDRRWPTIF